MSRTYESALSHLAALQSNRAVTSLFTPPSPSPSPGSKPDLNALAIPEMHAWLLRAGLPPSALASSGLRCIHVAGTKGKGSVCAYLTALLTHSADAEVRRLAGKVGTYTSPHLVSVRERIAIGGAPISRDLFARYFFEVWDACTEAARTAGLSSRQRDRQRDRQSSSSNGSNREEEKKKKKKGEEEEEEEEEEQISEAHLRGPATKPFYFRFLTLVALRAFLGEGVRSAVVECGIGGEYDSTNALPAELITASVVSRLGIDHVGMLGRTLPEIAWHKAGVCKAGRACFTRRMEGQGQGEGEGETMEVLRRRAREKGAVLVEVGDGDVERWGGVGVGVSGGGDAGVDASRKEPGSLEGEFQKYNQALAVLAAREHLRVIAASESSDAAYKPGPEEKLDAIPATFTSALQHARLRGRCETREDADSHITWLIDGAHTGESLREVARWFAGKMENLGEERGGAVLLFNQQDRDAAVLVDGLLRDIEARTSSSPSSSSSSSAAAAAAAAAADPEGTQAGEGQNQKRLFAHALFTRNDLTPRVLPNATDAGAEPEPEPEPEPERDLSAQTAAAEALRRVSPGTTTGVVDNVSDAVAEIRGLASRRFTDGGRGTVVLVTGSLHLVGALLRTLEPEAED
ncbi:FolC bifunctional protein [Xylaria cf. heliscus]|nr:FolC bifunctional protein [Xylaria cf. heliscus]